MTDSEVLSLAIRISAAFYAKREAFVEGVSAWELRDWLNIAVALTGAYCSFVCACRMGRLTRRHRWTYRLSYVGLLGGSFCLTFAPWLFGQNYVRIGALIFVSAVLIHLVVQTREWLRGNPPATMETEPAPLEFGRDPYTELFE